jgi:hypothetical protein
MLGRGSQAPSHRVAVSHSDKWGATVFSPALSGKGVFGETHALPLYLLTINYEWLATNTMLRAVKAGQVAQNDLFGISCCRKWAKCGKCGLPPSKRRRYSAALQEHKSRMLK